MEKEKVYFYAPCRCSLLGLQNEKDICHHHDKACHRVTQEYERCPLNQ